MAAEFAQLSPTPNSEDTQSGRIPITPAKRRLQSPAARPVEPIKTRRARLLAGERQLPAWASSRYQPRASIATVSNKNGHVSARNAGAMASPADVPPRRPSRPGTTHHQGSGRTPLSSATNGFSTCRRLRMRLDFLHLLRRTPDICVRAEHTAIA